MPQVVWTLAGRRAGGADPPRTTARNPDGSSRPRAVATRETRVAPPVRAAASTAAGSGAGRTVSGVPVCSALVTTERPPTWARGRQASQRSRPGPPPGVRSSPRPRPPPQRRSAPLPSGRRWSRSVGTTRASPGSTPRPPGRVRRSPSRGSRTAAGASDASRASAAGAGRRGSRGRTASPASQTRRSAATKASLPWATTATSAGTGST
jgi:hypothetical protein